MNKKLIVCIVANAGVGKTTLINEFLNTYGNKFSKIISFTDRDKRNEELDLNICLDHIFLSKEAMTEVLKLPTVLASTIYGDKRYCALTDQLQEKTIYAIDENGVIDLETMCSEQSLPITIMKIKLIREDANKQTSDSRASRDLERTQYTNYDATLNISNDVKVSVKMLFDTIQDFNFNNIQGN